MLPTSLRRATRGMHVRKVNGKVNIDQEIEAMMRKHRQVTNLTHGELSHCF